jgi:PAS domain S-box-containing protein
MEPVRPRLASWTRSPLGWAAISALILILYSGLSLALPQSSGLWAVGWVGAVITRGLAAVAAVLAGRAAGESPAARVWRYLALSLALWVTADGIQAAGYISTGTPADQPSAIDLIRLAGFLAAVPAFGSYSRLPAERFSRIRESLDIAILCLAVLALAWLIVVRSVIALGLVGPIQAFWASVSPVGHIMLFLLILRPILLSSDPNERFAFSLFGLAFLLLSWVELRSVYTSLLDTAQGLQPTVGGRMLAGLMMLLAVLILQGAFHGTRPTHPRMQRNLRTRVETIMPIAFTYLVLGSVALDWRLGDGLDPIGIAAAVLLSLLLVARQGVIAGQVEFRQYAALVNSSADMAFVARADGRLILENPALRTSLDPEARFDRRRYIADFVVPDRPLQEVLDEANDAGWSGEAQFRRVDSRTIPVYLSLRPVFDERRARPLLAATAHDLTRIKQREEELHRALDEVAAARTQLEELNRDLEQKVEVRTGQLEAMVRDLNRLNQDLKELDRLKTEFVALVSHELRTPLTNIQTGVELILTSYPKMKRGARESMELVQAETSRLTEFVETILDLSALEAGRFPLHLAEVDLAEIAAAVTDKSFNRSARSLVALEFPADLPKVDADRRAVASVLFHLIDNALKYAPGKPVVVSAEVEDEVVAVSVSDHGPGVPAAERERVFEMFHRLDSSDAREVYGHGLGLHLVRRFVETMQGDVRIEDGPMGGARVVFRIPQSRSKGESVAGVQLGSAREPG